jgi:hypothetical protein
MCDNACRDPRLLGWQFWDAKARPQITDYLHGLVSIAKGIPAAERNAGITKTSDEHISCSRNAARNSDTILRTGCKRKLKFWENKNRAQHSPSSGREYNPWVIGDRRCLPTFCKSRTIRICKKPARSCSNPLVIKSHLF